jgi:GH24 family phage-related lysozyme (muramidase)
MLFNLGKPKFLTFKKFILAVKDKDWEEASLQMESSKWYKQVGNRAKRLVKEMEEG